MGSTSDLNTMMEGITIADDDIYVYSVAAELDGSEITIESTSADRSNIPAVFTLDSAAIHDSIDTAIVEILATLSGISVVHISISISMRDSKSSLLLSRHRDAVMDLAIFHICLTASQVNFSRSDAILDDISTAAKETLANPKDLSRASIPDLLKKPDSIGTAVTERLVNPSSLSVVSTPV